MPYRGIMLDDSGAPFAYSVYGLERIFGEDAERAVRLMMRRTRPDGACGVIFRDEPVVEDFAARGFSGSAGMEHGPHR